MRRLAFILAVVLYAAPLAGPAALAAWVGAADSCCGARCPEASCPADAGDCLPLCLDCKCGRSERALPSNLHAGTAPCIVPLPHDPPECALGLSDPREVFKVPKPLA